MIKENRLELLLEQLLGDSINRISNFTVQFILNSRYATESSAKSIYRFLRKIGATNYYIAKNGFLLSMDKKFIMNNYNLLLTCGLNDDQVAANLNLLGRDPKKISNNFELLKQNGFSATKIASRASLLEKNIHVLKKRLKEYPEKIQELDDIKDGKETIQKQPQLLEISEDTLEANVMYHSHFHFRTLNGILLGILPQTKRKKIAKILREVFNYRELREEEKKEAIKKAYTLVRKRPTLLSIGCSDLDKRIKRLNKEQKN